MALIGMIIVIASVIGGYALAHGNFSTLWQPVELIIILGAAIGALVTSAPPKFMKLVLGGFKTVFGGHLATRVEYLEILACINAILSKIRKEGLISIEQDVENPTASALFMNYPTVLHNDGLMNYMTDNLKIISSTTIEAYRLDALMELDADANHHVELIPSVAIQKLGDAMPALGIVAAVLGVVLTMGKISEPPEVLGNSIGAALVGTFLGILFSYGFFQPFSSNIEYKANDHSVAFTIVRVSFVAFINGSSPQIAVEFGRRAIGGADRPTFAELEAYLRERK